MEDQSEVIHSLIRQIFKEKPHHGFTETQLMKLLYKLKAQLPEDDPLREVIPYYWYYHGPFCPDISNGVALLHATHEIKRTGYRFSFVGGRRSYVNLPEHIVVALRAVLKRFNSYANQDAFFDRSTSTSAVRVHAPHINSAFWCRLNLTSTC